MPSQFIRLSVCQSFYSFDYLSVCPFGLQSLRQPLFLSFCLSIFLSICLFIFLFICPSVFLLSRHHFFCVCPFSVSLSVCSSTYLPFNIYFSLFVCPSVYVKRSKSGMFRKLNITNNHITRLKYNLSSAIQIHFENRVKDTPAAS
jgi:hypothetical protein